MHFPIDVQRAQIHITNHSRSNRPGMATIHQSRPAESSLLKSQKYALLAAATRPAANHGFI